MLYIKFEKMKAKMKHSTRYSNFLTNSKDQTIYEHVKDLPFGESVYEPENGFDKFQLIQLGEGSREFKSALQYFVQAFGGKQIQPRAYHFLKDIAVNEFSLLEMKYYCSKILKRVNIELKR